MAKRTPITIDLGDDVDRPIKFYGDYLEQLQKKYGSLREMLNKTDQEGDLLYELMLEGLIDKGGFTVESLRKAFDVSLTQEIWLKLMEALTGNKIEPPNKRTIDPNSQTQTAQ